MIRKTLLMKIAAAGSARGQLKQRNHGRRQRKAQVGSTKVGTKSLHLTRRLGPRATRHNARKRGRAERGNREEGRRRGRGGSRRERRGGGGGGRRGRRRRGRR